MGNVVRIIIWSEPQLLLSKNDLILKKKVLKAKKEKKKWSLNKEVVNIFWLSFILRKKFFAKFDEQSYKVKGEKFEKEKHDSTSRL